MNAARPVLASSLRSWSSAAVLVMAGLACNVSASAGRGSSSPADATATAAAPASPVDTTIEPARMFADLEHLSGDAFMGRFTFSEHLGMAADYLAEQYTAMGVAPVGEGYRSPFEAPSGQAPGDHVVMWVEPEGGTSEQVPGKEISTLASGGGNAAYAAVVFVRDPARAKAGAVSRKLAVSPAPPPDSREAFVRALAELGPEGILLVGDSPPNAEASREALADVTIPVAWVSRATAKQWMAIEISEVGQATLPAIKLSMAAEREEVSSPTFNVLATIPGTVHPEQIVILGAHYDHIGTPELGRGCVPSGGDRICNGADDNGSGTAMVLEIARTFAEAGYQPERTLVFAHFAGEELGLYGSKALADDPPAAAPFAGGTVVAMINLDMVGRLGDGELAIGSTGSSDQWLELLQPLEPPGLPIVYERAINGRSDHANFYRKKIPVLFFFTGLHDDYHAVGDEFAKIDQPGMALIGQMVADITRTLADGAEISYAAPRTDDEGVVGRMPGSQASTVERRTDGSPKR